MLNEPCDSGLVEKHLSELLVSLHVIMKALHGESTGKFALLTDYEIDPPHTPLRDVADGSIAPRLWQRTQSQEVRLRLGLNAAKHGSRFAKAASISI